ncbi:GNAT family N-acetyltransferase [Cohnella pontilimi]|uniref:GNAT family N-acetyltransferase n=1 Tax=Cohnella pontilimi TaxID=2564100 RepID=A0A4U0FCK4_9BACL|nr:GNAT family N-acetyltransferase [Cohnella pontilimi]TJY41964.1 GNAT family N-acetyltransferase [Cohnella pontilimi]
MLLGREQAVRLFQELPAPLQIPTLHPDYIWADAARDPELQPVVFAYIEGRDKWIHGFHLSRIANSKHYDIQSPYGYGGPVSSNRDPDFLRRANERYAKWCIETGVVAEFIRFHPVIQNADIYSGQAWVDRTTVIVNLNDEDPSRGYRQLTKRKLKQAISQEVQTRVVDRDTFAALFPAIYSELMHELEAESFYHFPAAYFDALFKSLPSLYLASYLREEVVAAAVFPLGAEGAEYLLGASNQLGKQAGAMVSLMHEAIVSLKERGFNWLHLGGGTNGLSDNSLLFFKQGFSKLEGDFMIGKTVFLPDIYERWKQEWKKERGKSPDRVLFYRY